MKKYLLGTMMLVGAMAYGQGNQVIVPVDTTTGNATANVGIEVTGKVYSKTDKSLVVEIKSAASPDGRGFAFQMPDLFTSQVGEAMIGKFDAKVVENDRILALKQPIKTVLVGADGTEQATVTNSTLVGTATGTQLVYTVTGESKTGEMVHNGVLSVVATAGSTAGSYSDNTVALRVKLEGQTAEL